MPRYFFDVHDGTNTLDDAGTELADVAAARVEAIGVLSELTRQFPPDGALKEHRIIVRAENGDRVLEAILTFRCVVLGERRTHDSSSHVDVVQASTNVIDEPSASRT